MIDLYDSPFVVSQVLCLSTRGVFFLLFKWFTVPQLQGDPLSHDRDRRQCVGVNFAQRKVGID
jgi:hypothetical protein